MTGGPSPDILQVRLRLLGGFGLLGLAIASTVVAFALHSPQPYGLDQLGVWISQVTLALFALAFLIVGLLTVLLRRHSSPAIAGLVLTALGTFLVFQAGGQGHLFGSRRCRRLLPSCSISASPAVQSSDHAGTDRRSRRHGARQPQLSNVRLRTSLAGIRSDRLA